MRASCINITNVRNIGLRNCLPQRRFIAEDDYSFAGTASMVIMAI